MGQSKKQSLPIVTFVRFPIIHLFVQFLVRRFYPRKYLNVPPVGVQMVIIWHTEHYTHRDFSIWDVVAKYTDCSSCNRTISFSRYVSSSFLRTQTGGKNCIRCTGTEVHPICLPCVWCIVTNTNCYFSLDATQRVQ